MGGQLPPPDALISEIAARQHGSIAHRQLRGLGLGDDAIHYRVRAGRLHVVHRGVYAVGHPHLTRHGEWMAAVLAGDEGALLSHWSAARLWGLAGGRQRPIHVTVARNGGRKDRGVRFHHPRSLHREDRALRDRIPVTSVARTLLDNARGLTFTELQKPFEEAIRVDLLDALALARLLDRSNGRHGARQLRRLLAEHLHLPDDTRPGLEAEFAAFCRACKLPMPVFNALVGGYIVDALWPAQRLIVELDSRAFHSSWRARESDAVRDGELQALGYRVLRVTATRLRREPDALERTIRRLLLANDEGPRAGGPSGTNVAEAA
jgi:predicted transcriptional regulator of viral defense system